MKDLHQVSRRQFITWSRGAASRAMSAGAAIISPSGKAKAAETITLPLP